MVPNFLPRAVEAVAADVLSLCGIPGSTAGLAISVALEAMMKHRQDAAREVLLTELRKGEKTLHQIGEVDELAAMLFRYSRAAQEGAARLNLRLMAKVIAGQAQAGALVADEFLAWADVLASLRREEVILLAEMTRAVDAAEAAPGVAWSAATIHSTLCERLIPCVFANEGELSAAALALSRTGFVLAETNYSGSPQHIPSPLLRRVQGLADFQDALREEGTDLEGGRNHP